jgi:hypothetical protein
MSAKETQRLRQLAGRLSERGVSGKRKDVSEVPAEVHAPHGERGDFIKVTATLSAPPPHSGSLDAATGRVAA